MATLVTPSRKALTLAEFVFRAGPIFWQRLSEDRKRPVEPSPRIPQLSVWPQEGVQAAWIGHSTVLICVDGFTILTDPVFSTRIGIKIGPFTLGMKRLVDPAIQPLPPPRRLARPGLCIGTAACDGNMEQAPFASRRMKHTDILTV